MFFLPYLDSSLLTYGFYIHCIKPIDGDMNWSYHICSLRNSHRSQHVKVDAIENISSTVEKIAGLCECVSVSPCKVENTPCITTLIIQNYNYTDRINYYPTDDQLVIIYLVTFRRRCYQSRLALQSCFPRVQFGITCTLHLPHQELTIPR